VDTSSIEHIIEQAKQHAGIDSYLASQFKTVIANSHIDIDGDQPEQRLADFVEHYIRFIPSEMPAISKLSHQAGTDLYIQPLLVIIADFFFTPPSASENEQEGLHLLLGAAYVGNRLFAEINDNYVSYSPQLPILSHDLTTANLLVHTLLGETFGNELDNIIELTLKRMQPKAAVFSSDTFKQHIKERLAQQGESQPWPCLAAENGIHLALRSSPLEN
jgi:hypothetical protein